MRQPLRFQIMFPMLGLIFTALISVSALNAYLAAERASRQIERQLQGITHTLEQTNFPLTDTVLRQLRGLSGAEFILATKNGEKRASSLSEASEPALTLQATDPLEVDSQQQHAIHGENYFHSIKQLARRNVGEQQVLHIFYPESGYRQAWKDAVLPPLLIGLIAVVLAVMSAIAIAARVSRPLSLLKEQAIHIAQGQFQPTPLPRRHDEVRDLAVAINQMASMLDQYERNVRVSERQRTLAQLGGGIAHQMRNAATGCRMAVDILADEHALHDQSESLTVARRQLELMESHIKRFLALSRPVPEVKFQTIDLSELIEETLPLVRSAAHHVHVTLTWNPPEQTISVLGDAAELQQLLINLLLNSIEAVASEVSSSQNGTVEVRLHRLNARNVELVIMDSGPGPHSAVAETLFEPFVTAKPDGVGLGLSVARQVVQRHGGRVSWDRDGGTTCFRVELPTPDVESQRVTVVGS